MRSWVGLFRTGGKSQAATPAPPRPYISKMCGGDSMTVLLVKDTRCQAWQPEFSHTVENQVLYSVCMKTMAVLVHTFPMNGMNELMFFLLMWQRKVEENMLTTTSGCCKCSQRWLHTCVHTTANQEQSTHKVDSEKRKPTFVYALKTATLSDPDITSSFRSSVDWRLFFLSINIKQRNRGCISNLQVSTIAQTGDGEHEEATENHSNGKGWTS